MRDLRSDRCEGRCLVVGDEWDFFVSYTQDDRTWAEWIAWELEERGHRVLVQAWDMVPGSNWISRMDEGVQRASRTIALLSPAYLTSVYGAAEWQAAWRDDPLGQDRKLLVLRVQDCERPGLLGSIVSADLFGLGEAAARQRLHQVIRGALDGRAKPDVRPEFPAGTRALATAPRFPGALPAIWNVPVRNPNFTGRAESMERLRAAMRSSATVAVHSLRGLGGVGKSQLAIEYAHRFASDFDLVWWIPSEQPALIPDHFSRLAASLGLDADPASVVAVVLAALRGEQRWLLVFDNAEDPAAVRPYLPSGEGHVLITTRRAGFGSLSTVLDVDVLDRAESVDLLRRRVPAITLETAEELAGLLGDLPLAIEQASAYLEVTGLPPSDYESLLRTRTADMIKRGRVEGREETLATLWDMSLDVLASQDQAAVQLLDLLAWLAPEPVPLDLFTGHPDVLPQPLADVVADPPLWADTVGRLVDWFLVRRTSADVTIAHRLLQHSLRARTAADESKSPAVVSQELLAADLPGEIIPAPQNWPRWRVLLPHVLAVYNDLSDGVVPTIDNSAWLLDRAATYLQTHGRPGDARPLFERALTITESTYAPDHPTVASRLNNLARVLRDLGHPDEARPLLERAVAIIEAANGPDDHNLATCLGNLGRTLRDLGRPDEARTLMDRALAIDEAIFGPGHPEVAIDLNNLAGVLRDLGYPSEARTMLERALTITEAAYGPRHPEVAAHLNNLAGVLLDLNRPSDARPLYERALTITENTYGPHHPTIATRLNNLAGALRHLGYPSEARTMLERALTITENTYGPHHPTIAIRLSNLANVLRDLDHLGEALPLYERSLTITEAAYGPDHPVVAIRLNNLAGVLQLLGRPDEAQPLFERADEIRKRSPAR